MRHFKKEIEERLQETLRQRKEQIDLETICYVQPDEDIYNFRKCEIINSLIRMVVKDRRKKAIKRKRIRTELLQGRSRSMKKRAPGDYLIGKLLRIIHGIALKVRSEDVYDAICGI